MFMENRKKQLIIYSASFVLPIILYLLVLYYGYIAPFGEKSLLHANLELKILPFFSYFRTLFAEHNDIFYSFSGIGSCYDFFAYYLFSPFNFLLFLFPDNAVNIGITLIIALKLGFCGLTCAYFLNKEFKENYMSIIFACSFALCGYNLSNISNIMFYDGIILFPLVLLGISKILKENKDWLFFVTLTLAIITNCLMGYIIAVFSVMYFVYKLILADKEIFTDILSKLNKLFRDIVLSFLLTAWIWVPAFSSFEKFSNGFVDYLCNFFVIRTDFFPMLAKFFISGSVNIISEDFSHTPNFNIGYLAFAFFILFFINKNFSLKEKIVDASFLVFLYLTFTFNGLFSVWNLGINLLDAWAEPVFIASFTVSFLLISIAYKSFLEIKCISKKNLITAAIIYFVLAVIVMNFHFEFVEDGYVKFDIVCFMLSLYICYVILENKEHLNSIVPVLFLIYVLNTGINMFTTFKDLMYDSRMYKKTEFNNYYNGFKKAVDYVKAKDKSFYRIESDASAIVDPFYKVFRNNPLLFGYNGITVFNYWGNSELIDFYKAIGISWFANSRNQFIYDVETDSVPYSLLGVKYVLTYANSMPKTYEKIYSFEDDSDNTVNIYENKVAFPFAFIIDRNVALFGPYEGINNFDTQNDILKILANKDLGDVYDYSEVWKIGNVSKEREENFKPVNIEKNYKVDKNRDMFLSIKDNNNLNNYFEKIFKDDKRLYYHIGNKNAYFWLNPDKSQDYLNLKFVKENYQSWIEFFLKNEFSMFMATENADLLRKYQNIFAKKGCEVEKISSSHLKIHVNVKEKRQFLFLTMPYDKGWKIKVDGRKKKAQKVFDSLMVIPLKAGDEIVEMRYVPKMFQLGSGISLLTLLFLMAVFGLNKVNKDEQ